MARIFPLSMADTPNKTIGRIPAIVTLIAAVICGWIVLWQTNVHPRTDDASVRANLIGIAPQVSGPILKLYVKDNQYVKKGDPLFEIDPKPYEYALERAKSEQATLEEKIADLERTIAAQSSGVESSQAAILTSEASVTASAAAVDAAKSGIARAQAGVTTAEAEYSTRPTT